MTVTEIPDGGVATAVVNPPAVDPPAPAQRRAEMRVRKRNGSTEPVDVNKIVRAVERWVDGLDDVDPLRVATRTISGLYDGATTAELDRLHTDLGDLAKLTPAERHLVGRLVAFFATGDTIVANNLVLNLYQQPRAGLSASMGGGVGSPCPGRGRASQEGTRCESGTAPQR